MEGNKKKISSKNTLSETSKIMCDQTVWHHGPAKLIYKINHHNKNV